MKPERVRAATTVPLASGATVRVKTTPGPGPSGASAMGVELTAALAAVVKF